MMEESNMASVAISGLTSPAMAIVRRARDNHILLWDVIDAISPDRCGDLRFSARAICHMDEQLRREGAQSRHWCNCCSERDGATNPDAFDPL